MKKINSIIIATFSLMAMALVSCNKGITRRSLNRSRQVQFQYPLTVSWENMLREMRQRLDSLAQQG